MRKRCGASDKDPVTNTVTPRLMANTAGQPARPQHLTGPLLVDAAASHLFTRFVRALRLAGAAYLGGPPR